MSDRDYIRNLLLEADPRGLTSKEIKRRIQLERGVPGNKAAVIMSQLRTRGEVRLDKKYYHITDHLRETVARKRKPAKHATVNVMADGKVSFYGRQLTPETALALAQKIEEAAKEGRAVANHEVLDKIFNSVNPHRATVLHIANTEPYTTAGQLCQTVLDQEKKIHAASSENL